MNPIDLQAFQRIIAAHGQAQGQAYFDAENSIVHELYPERIVFQTDYLDYSSYTVEVADTGLQVRKTRLDNYHRGHKAQLIDDEMDDDDWAELAGLWQRLSRDLDPAPAQPRVQVDVPAALTELFYYLLDEAHAESLAENLPTPTQEWDWTWRQIESALGEAGLLAEFEWQDWPVYGVQAINALSPLRQLGIEIPHPDSATLEAVTRDNDWQRAILQYFNVRLDAHDLKLLAIGTHFDENQAFACLPMNGLNLANALVILDTLGIVHKY